MEHQQNKHDIFMIVRRWRDKHKTWTAFVLTDACFSAMKASQQLVQYENSWTRLSIYTHLLDWYLTGRDKCHWLVPFPLKYSTSLWWCY